MDRCGPTPTPHAPSPAGEGRLQLGQASRLSRPALPTCRARRSPCPARGFRPRPTASTSCLNYFEGPRPALLGELYRFRNSIRAADRPSNVEAGSAPNIRRLPASPALAGRSRRQRPASRRLVTSFGTWVAENYAAGSSLGRSGHLFANSSGEDGFLRASSST